MLPAHSANWSWWQPAHDCGSRSCALVRSACCCGCDDPLHPCSSAATRDGSASLEALLIGGCMLSRDAELINGGVARRGNVEGDPPDTGHEEVEIRGRVVAGAV